MSTPRAFLRYLAARFIASLPEQPTDLDGAERQLAQGMDALQTLLP
jgi:hypothetical protein